MIFGVECCIRPHPFANEVKGHLISPLCPMLVQYVHTKCSFAATYCATVYVYICMCLAVHQCTIYINDDILYSKKFGGGGGVNLVFWQLSGNVPK